MVKKFLEYFLESTEDLSLPYYLSRKLYDFLIEIVQNTGDSEVKSLVNEIIRIESKTDIKSTFTFVDLTEKNDSVSMIQSSRVHQIWKKSGSTVNFKDWISIEKLNQESPLWTSNRSQIAIGRAFRKMSSDVGKKFTDKTIENFVNTFKSLYDFKWNLDGRFELVEGELIRKWYNSENYASRGGQLGNSCMRYPECSSYFDIYVYNPEVCKMLVLYNRMDKKEISGRALVWKTQSGEAYVDRIYTNNDSDIKLFESYVENLGWETKWSHNRSVKLTRWKFEKYPYMDSFSVLDVKNGILYSDDDKWPAENLYQLKRTDGLYDSGENLVFSEYYSEWIERDDATYLDGDWIKIDECIYLEYRDEYIHPNSDYNYSNYHGDNILPDDSVYSEFLNDYLFKEESIKIPIGNKSESGEAKFDYIPESNLTLEDVAYFDGDEDKFGKTLTEMILTIPSTGVNYLKDGIVMCYNIDGKYLTRRDAEVLKIEIVGSPEKMSVEKYLSLSIGKPEISKEELERYIMESDFDFKDHLDYIRSLNDIYYQAFFGANPLLMSFRSLIQKSMISQEDSEILNRMIKICLVNHNLNAWVEVKNSRRISHFDVSKLDRYFWSKLEGENRTLAPFDVFKAFQLSGLLRGKILKDPKYLEAWYHYYELKQS